MDVWTCTSLSMERFGIFSCWPCHDRVNTVRVLRNTRSNRVFDALHQGPISSHSLRNLLVEVLYVGSGGGLV